MPANAASHLRAVLPPDRARRLFLAILTYIEPVSEAPAGEVRDLAASLGPDAEEAYVISCWPNNRPTGFLNGR